MIHFLAWLVIGFALLWVALLIGALIAMRGLDEYGTPQERRSAEVIAFPRQRRARR